MKNFREQVFEIVKKIPSGHVVTYGQIALALNKPKAAREVGWMLHSNDSWEVPCHRVVNKEGRLASSFAFDGINEQKRRLSVEGVSFVDEQHVDLAKHLVEIRKSD